MTDTSNYVLARDEIFALFVAEWNASAAAIVGYIPEIRYQGLESLSPDNSKFWARLSTQMVAEGQATLGAAEAGGQKLYESNGLFFAQVFGPLNNSDTWEKLQLLAIVAKRSIRGKKTSSGVWFRNEKINEIGSDGRFEQINAVAEFQYREIG